MFGQPGRTHELDREARALARAELLFQSNEVGWLLRATQAEFAFETATASQTLRELFDACNCVPAQLITAHRRLPPPQTNQVRKRHVHLIGNQGRARASTSLGYPAFFDEHHFNSSLSKRMPH